MSHFRRSLSRLSAGLVLAGLALLTACNMPGYGEATPSGAGSIYTAAAQTVDARFTAVAQNPPTRSPITVTPGTTSQATPAVPLGTPSPPAATLAPSPGATQGAECDSAEFEADVTIPDNTDVSPGATFVKTWRVRNTSTCAWTADYAAVLTSGEAMGAPASVPVTTGSVPPGQSVEVSVSFVAPEQAGRYRSEWKLRTPSGSVFGMGDNDRPFWAQVDVVVRSGITFDFISQASSAEWVSGVGNSLTGLAFGGNDDDPRGAAKIKDGIVLENGANSGKILLTVPAHERDGVIAGTFPEYTVQPGDRLRARIGFWIPAGECQAGEAEFQVGYREGDRFELLQTWEQTCDRVMNLVELDLSELRGRTVRFIFAVRAGGSIDGDWAVWNSALIEN